MIMNFDSIVVQMIMNIGSIVVQMIMNFGSIVFKWSWTLVVLCSNDHELW